MKLCQTHSTTCSRTPYCLHPPKMRCKVRCLFWRVPACGRKASIHTWKVSYMRKELHKSLHVALLLWWASLHVSRKTFGVFNLPYRYCKPTPISADHSIYQYHAFQIPIIVFEPWVLSDLFSFLPELNRFGAFAFEKHSMIHLALLDMFLLHLQHQSLNSVGQRENENLSGVIPSLSKLETKLRVVSISH